jgi:KUP system potassium uptake protein
MRIDHTSVRQRGQIYIPSINWALMISCIALVLAFRSSGNLAAAYGVAVTTTMMITTILLFVVMRERWRWSLVVTVPITVLFLIVDLAFWGANLLKIPEGGWLPLVVGAIVFTLMTTWNRGRQILAERLKATTQPFREYGPKIEQEQPLRVPGTAVYMYSNPRGTPPALLHNLLHNKVIHETVLFVSVQTTDIPRVPLAQRIEVQPLQKGFTRIVFHYGFRQSPNVPRDLTLLREHGLTLDFSDVSYFLGRERLLTSDSPGMALWRERLFALMSRNARNATDFYGLPPERVVELGAQIEL